MFQIDRRILVSWDRMSSGEYPAYTGFAMMLKFEPIVEPKKEIKGVRRTRKVVLVTVGGGYIGGHACQVLARPG